MAYVELISTSNFSFLRGGSHPGELVKQAAALGLGGIGVADHNSLAGVVRGHIAAREVWATNPGFRYLVGARLVFSDKTPDVIAYPTDRAAYGRLCHLLTTGNRRAEKGDCLLRFDDLVEHLEGQLLIIFGDNEPFSADEFVARRLAALAPGRVWLGISCRLKGNDRHRLSRMRHIAEQSGIPMLASNDVLYHHYERRTVPLAPRNSSGSPISSPARALRRCASWWRTILSSNRRATSPTTLNRLRGPLPHSELFMH